VKEGSEGRKEGKGEERKNRRNKVGGEGSLRKEGRKEGRPRKEGRKEGRPRKEGRKE
jgi:hypothetical protein